MKEKEKDIFEQTTKFNTGIKLYMFQTGSIKTKLKHIKMNQGEEPYEIPVPWFLIKHPERRVIVTACCPALYARSWRGRLGQRRGPAVQS